MMKRVEFGEYIKYIREQKRIPQGRVCDGICSKVLYHYYEEGKSCPGFWIRNRFLSRLGVSQKNRIAYVHYDEYSMWEKYWRLVECVDIGGSETALKLINEIQKCFSEYEVSSIERQMIYALKAKVLLQINPKSDVRYLYFMAIKETIPDFQKKRIDNFLLSIEELYYILAFYKSEYEYYSDNIEKNFSAEMNELSNNVWDLIKYIEQSELDTDNKFWLLYFAKRLENELGIARTTYVCGNNKTSERSKVKEDFASLCNIPKIYCESQVIDVYRRKQKKSIEDVSECGVSPRTIQRIVSKQTKPKQQTLNAIFDYLEIPECYELPSASMI